MTGGAIVSMIVIFAIVFGGLAYFLNISLKGED